MTKDTEALREALAKCRHQFQSYATEHKAKSDAAYKAWDDARYWGNVDEQDAAHKEYHKRLTQTQTNEALVAMIDAALDPDTIGSHFGNGGGFDPSAELGFDPTAEVGDEVFPHDAGESAPVAWMLRSNETGEVIFDEVCVWRDRESAEDAVAEIDPELMEYSADAVPFPLYAHPPHPAPVDPVAGGEALREAIKQAIREYMQSAGIPVSEFDPDFVVRMVSAMMVSFHKYGRVADAYPLKFDAASDVRARMGKYRTTGNMHYLVDAANFAMIEAMHPAPERNAAWGENDAADSPGRTTASGHRLIQETNDGTRIMGEKALAALKGPAA